MSFNNVVFDWSGTLSDDFDGCYEAGMKTLESFGVKRFSREEYVRRFEMPYMGYYRKLGVTAPKEEIDRRFRKIILETKPKPLPGARELLEQLSLRGKKMAVLSSHPHEKLLAEASEYGFAGFFEKIAGGVHDKRLALAGLLEELGFEKPDTVFVGDHMHEIEAGKQAGVAVAAVPSKYTPRAALAAAKPDYLLDSITDVLKVVSE
ncbi:MAG: HAD-IA family hydrolase [Candidatus Micrarchaeota archaeon]|nr:HAD-IA family hydrolase [Candidatus Micrarchaeota archaeon]